MSKASQRTRAGATSYLLVVCSVILTTMLRLALNPLLGRKAALIMYFPALVFSAWVGGWGGGLIALTLSALAATYFFLAPAHSLSLASHDDQVSLLIFAVVGLSVSALSSSQRKARRQAEDTAADAREAEFQARQSASALSNSEARKSAVLEAALDCIVTADAQGRTLEFNPAAERTFGYSRMEVLGQTIAETIVPPMLREAHLRGLGHYLSTGEGSILRQRIEVVGMRKGGEEFPVEIAIVPTSGNGQPEFTAYLRDITERRRQEAERADLLQQVQMTTHRQRQFLRDVLASVTAGRLILCESEAELPAPPTPFGPPILLSMTGGLRELRQATQGVCQAAGLSDERCYDLVTAASEAGMNAVAHGGGGTGKVSVGVEDYGSGITVENLPRATLSRGFSTKATLGHGLKMMIETVDRLYLLTGSSGTTVVLEMGRDKPLPGWL